MLGLVVLVVAAATHMAWCTPTVMLGLFGVLLLTSLSVRDREGMVHVPSVAEAYQGCGMALGECWFAWASGGRSAFALGIVETVPMGWPTLIRILPA